LTYKNKFSPAKLGTVSPQMSGVHYAIPVMGAFAAILLGLGIGQGHWIFAVGALCVPILLFYPVQVAMGFFAVLIPFDSIAVLGEAQKGRTLTWFAGAGAIAVLFGAGLAYRRLKIPPVASLWWVLFAFWCAMTSVWALSPETSVHELPSSLAILALYLASSCFRYTKSELQAVTYLAIFGGCCAAVWTAYMFRQGNFYEAGQETRASLIVAGRHANPDGLAMTFLLPISLAFGYFLSHRRGLVRVCMLAAMAICTLGLFLTMSRGAVVALAAVVLLYVYRLRLGSRLVVPIILLAILLAFMPAAFFVRFQQAGSSGGSGRLDIWTVGLTAFRHYGFVGAGFFNFPFAYTNYAGEAHHYEGNYRDSHNIYLAMGVELGIVGLTLFALAMRSQFRAFAKSRNYVEGNHLRLATQAAAVGVLVFGLFGNILWTKGFWFTLMILTAAGALEYAPDPDPAAASAMKRS
jgi:O-antigen ligase